MDTLRNMRTFVCVVQVGSFTAASQSLDVTTSVVSRAVSELESYLRTRLLNRSTRRLGLTPAGGQYFKRCVQILADIDKAQEEVSGAHEQPLGPLRVHSFVSVGQHYILPAISRYRTRYPDVTIELTLSQEMPDLFDGKTDVSLVTASSLPDSSLISHRLGSTYSVLCASQSYLHTHGVPQTPDDLTDHDCLVLKTPAFPAHEWVLEGPDGQVEIKVDGALQVNVAESLAVAIRDGLGIGLMPIYAAIEGLRNGSLLRVLPAYTQQKMGVFALHPSRKFVDAKTRTWIDFLGEHLPQMIKRDQVLLDEPTLAQI
ncbi:LysR family transcriptional regulator [Burkholderia multivorans]|uniref:LysR family transcriptional regulator n=1 Tax=Burkholderiaceae TaxID=119060 RepID=UPI00158F4A77|nr:MULTISPECIES: LysR family transcriptional regulator [Burkholderia cepacia complex]MCO8318122.1 LysR family transcriptional regulator [Burkholderia multivorans]MCO8550456.1 LysR family transcriptional regulator [Burkholderia multivorans]MCO8557864.1 LysR family transcriptional regulator [Burkholderia multivorans]MCO8621436.1 LysR family transcriptional regulator [Burkholderia multivorans]